jgi:hypothetical protein
MALRNIGEAAVVIGVLALTFLTTHGVTVWLRRRFGPTAPSWPAWATLVTSLFGYSFLAAWFIH